MSAISAPSERSWRQRRATGWTYLALLPHKKLLHLYLAIFFLFATFGFYGDLTYAGGEAPIWCVLAVSAINGAYAVIYPYVLIHKPKVWLWLVALGSCLLGPAISTAMSYITKYYPSHFANRYSGIVFSAQGILLCVIASYIFLIGFTRAQASKYDLHGLSLPSEKVGGDLVDIVPVSRGGVVAYVADVSGHGLQAGILMGMVKTAVRTILLEEFDDPARLLHALCDRLNRALPGVKEAHMYATLSALYLAPDGRVSYTLAAHPAILHYRADVRAVTELACEQLPVGLLPVNDFSSFAIEMGPGDILAITTDGILEACNGQEEEFGCGRVAALLAPGDLPGGAVAGAHRAARVDPEISLEETGNRIMQAVRAFGKQVDDQTLLLIRRRTSPGMLQQQSAA